jgi:glycine amidinotransferase/scyllo-inosamine-4-phosphate amidinotransferase 1
MDDSVTRSSLPTVPRHRPAHSCDEFSPLREVIVGNPAGARIPRPDISAWLNLYGDLPRTELDRVRRGEFPERVVEQTAEDLQVLIDTLRGLDVEVHQVPAVDHAQEFGTPHWRTDGFYNYCPRDLALVIGSVIIETPSPMRARYFELFGMRELFQQYMLNGSPWIAAPRPQLTDELFQLDDLGRPVLGEQEPAFEAANVLRCGRDLFYQVSSSGNELGRIWLERTLDAYGDFVVHPLRGIYEYTHIDSTIAFLRPGLVLLNPERINDANLPDVLRKWDVIWCPPMNTPATGSPYPLSSPWIGMNLLMVNPGLAIVDAAQHELISVLERNGVQTLPLTLRHARTLGGGFHCVTLDVHRDGGMESYFD